MTKEKKWKKKSAQSNRQEILDCSNGRKKNSYISIITQEALWTCNRRFARGIRCGSTRTGLSSPRRRQKALPALRRPDAFVHELQDNVARIGVHHHVEG